MSTPAPTPERILGEYLSHLEKREVGLLTWGLADGSFGDDELEALTEKFLDDHDYWDAFPEADRLIELAEQRRVLYPFRLGADWRYRTRMAETVRLMLRLRQLFPRDMDDLRWLNAPELVADARFLIRPRAYPRRNIPAPDVLAALEPLGLGEGWQDVVSRLVGSRELAEFQVAATRRILRELRSEKPTGTVVCAGTGSGKTLAFYLPAFVDVAATLREGKWVRCLALYPRNELLKDQFTEAYTQARRLDELAQKRGTRKLLIGAFFGPTPRHANAFDSPWPPPGWDRVQGGYHCPLMRCPRPGCEGELLWRDDDRRANRERLVCRAEGCSKTVEQDEVVLTRERLLTTPPDILFTTTEMLNQRLSDSRFNRLFGVGLPALRKPRFLLLDEAHTYTGTSGAQAALLFRRWRHVSRSRPHLVGLSATLRDAQRFFASLTGLPTADVEVLQPRANELEQSGMEYMLALRGDPASGTSLLSTSLQATLLLHRALDPITEPVSGGLFGRKLFLFTDDLDVTNRLFFYLRDAEGQDSWGNPDPANPMGSLANLRASTRPDARRRFLDGQTWNLCEWIGHPLEASRLPRVGRTSSQDAGVDGDAEELVATAALEVGFDDPLVGAVLQHKAPIDPASFLQRKGRAGRNPAMRPWTVVVLSDFGRDRIAYQSYELLFDPELPPRELPVENRHVLRMQAVFAMLDWLGFQLEGFAHGSVWQDVAVPFSERTAGAQRDVRARQERIAELAEELLHRAERREDLAQYLQGALAIDAEEVDALLWSPPRPLLTAVVPTLVRRLGTQWQSAASADGREFFEHNAPLPEFVPRALFQDLNLPEVTILTREQQRGEGERRDAMGIAQALGEFAPGRVSRRFGIRHRYARHWVAPASLDDPEQDLPLAAFVSSYEAIGIFDYHDDEGNLQQVACVRPWRIEPTTPPRHVLDSANSFLQWKTQLVPCSEGVPMRVPASKWSGVLAGLEFFTHAHNCPIEVRRFATDSHATIGFEDGRRTETQVRFVDTAEQGDPVALGFAFEADALALRLKLPPAPHMLLSSRPDLLRAVRPSLFQHRVRESAALDGVVNVFGRDWLAQAYLAVVLSHAQSGVPVAEVVAQLRTANAVEQLRQALDILFQAIPLEVGDEDSYTAPSSSDDAHRQRGHTRLLEALAEQLVVEALNEAGDVLWEAPQPSWDGWLLDSMKTTLGAAALDALQAMCPEVDAREVVDPDAGPRPADASPVPTGTEEVWLTETAVGGGGVLEKAQRQFGDAPHRFFDLLSRALEPTDFEVTDRQLCRLLEELADPDALLTRNVARLRAAQTQSHEALKQALDDLLDGLRSANFVVSHPVVAALNSRIVRPGSSPRTDELLRSLLACWRQAEEDLDMEIDGRTFAWLQSADEAVIESLRQAFCLPHTPSRSWSYSTLSSLFWPRGVTARRQRFWVRNPFASLVGVEPRLVASILQTQDEPLSTTQADWRPRAERTLLEQGAVTLRAPTADEARAVALAFASEPLDTGTRLVYARVRGADRTASGYELQLECGAGA